MKLQHSIAPLSVALALVMAGPSIAQELEVASVGEPSDPLTGEELRINYDVNMGGFTLGTGNLRAQFTDSTYASQISIRTYGLAEWLFQSRYENTSAGLRDGEDIFPQVYTSDFQGPGDDYQLVRIGYDGSTPYLVESDPSYGPRLERFPVTGEQRENSYDPLNAAMHLVSGMAFSDEQPCGERVQVFDGRRRYDLVMDYVETTETRVRNGRVWDGEAIVCSLNYEEVAGFKPQPEDDELPRPPLTIYFGQVNGEYWIPLRVRAPTPLGHMVMIATHYAIDDWQAPVEVEPAGMGEAQVEDAAAVN